MKTLILTHHITYHPSYTKFDHVFRCFDVFNIQLSLWQDGSWKEQRQDLLQSYPVLPNEAHLLKTTDQTKQDRKNWIWSLVEWKRNAWKLNFRLTAKIKSYFNHLIKAFFSGFRGCWHLGLKIYVRKSGPENCLSRMKIGNLVRIIKNLPIWL